MSSRSAVVIATWFGCGYFPCGPGTVGSLAGTIIAGVLAWNGAGRPILLLLTALLLWPGIWSATQTAHILGRKDPGLVVVDEVLGQWITFMGAAVHGWKTLLVGFLLFRLFDIWKPWPVRQFEKLPEGVGIVLDDLAAGLYGALFLFLGRQLRLY